MPHNMKAFLMTSFKTKTSKIAFDSPIKTKDSLIKTKEGHNFQIMLIIVKSLKRLKYMRKVVLSLNSTNPLYLRTEILSTTVRL